MSDELWIIQRANDPGHHEIVPAKNADLTVDQYRDALAELRIKP